MAGVVGPANPGTDPYGGLSGYRREVSGRPTAINGQLPAFRGVKNKPGDAVKAGPIKSSSNHPDRKSNVLVPYTRVVPLDEVHDVGRMSPGDVVWISSGPRENLTVAGPNRFTGKPAYYQHALPGYSGTANSYMTKLVGMDWINKHLGNGRTKLANLVEHEQFPEMITDRNCLIGSDRVADEWRAVPFLQEWCPDGVVLSNDQPESYYGSGHGSRECQVFNIGIQGPAPLNNGYEDHAATGALTRPPPTMEGSQGHKSAHGDDAVRRHAGPNYHTYPLQMFDRKPAPLMDCYVGLIATAHYDTAAQLHVKFPNLTRAAIDASPNAINPDTFARLVAENEINKKALADYTDDNAKAVGDPTKRNLPDPAAAAGWVAPRTLREIYDALVLIRTKVVHTFRFECFSSRQAQGMNPTLQDDIAAHPAGKRQRHEGWRWETLQRWWVAKQAWEARAYGARDPGPTPDLTKTPGGDSRILGDRDFFVGPSVKDFRCMVGAWRIGKVLDTKAFKGEYFNGGPTDTGYRLTVNIALEWMDWRALRRRLNTHNFPLVDADKKRLNNAALAAGAPLPFEYPNRPGERDDEKRLSEQPPQIGDCHFNSGRWKGLDDDCRILQWPTEYKMEWPHAAGFSRYLDDQAGFGTGRAAGALGVVDPYAAVYAAGNRNPDFYKDRAMALGKTSDFAAPVAGGDPFAGVNGVEHNPNIPVNPQVGYSYRGKGGANLLENSEQPVDRADPGYIAYLYPTYMPVDSLRKQHYGVGGTLGQGVGTHHTKAYYGHPSCADLPLEEQRILYFRARGEGTPGAPLGRAAPLPPRPGVVPVEPPVIVPNLGVLDPSGFMGPGSGDGAGGFGAAVDASIAEENLGPMEAAMVTDLLGHSDLYGALLQGFNPLQAEVDRRHTVSASVSEAPRVVPVGTGVVNMEVEQPRRPSSTAAPGTAAAGTAAAGAAAPQPPVRERAGGASAANMPQPAATATKAAAASTTPASRPPPPRRAAATASASAVDAVFSSILGGSADSTQPQPLNPAHRSAGPAASSGAATGASASGSSGPAAPAPGSDSGGSGGQQRSFPRRKRGAE